MPFHLRLAVIAALATGALIAYGTSRYYSTALITCVVEQALLQKLPQDVDPAMVHNRFNSLLSAMPNRQARLEKLLSMSQYLEKLQRLTPRELDELLRKDAGIS